ncbi:hypothetical protein CR513_15191, partial [Mucuna pruriens]
MEEYEACNMGIMMALDHQVKKIKVCGDSTLVIYQLCGEWETQDAKLIPYDTHVKEMLEYFERCMTISSSNILYELDPEIDRTLCRLRKEPMENNDRTLKELATPDVVYLPWSIQYPQLELAQSYELKSGLIHLLPKFHGLTCEDPHKHLKEFHVVYSTMRLEGISEDYIKMKTFPFSLDGAAKDWLYL